MERAPREFAGPFCEAYSAGGLAVQLAGNEKADVFRIFAQ